MSRFLRFFGLLNTGIWLGGAIFFTFGIGPAAFSKEMQQLLGENNSAYLGAIAQIFIHRYFCMQLICAGVALLHLTVERFYLGKAWQQRWLSILLGLLGIALLGAVWIEPKIKHLHGIKYSVNVPAQTRAAAAQSLAKWHAASQITNLLALCALGGYFWHLANPPDTTRFITAPNFRG